MKTGATRGFTLIELVAAMSIFAIIAVIAQQSMFSAMAQSTRLTRNGTDLAELELSVSLVTRDLENIAPRPVRVGGNETQAALILADASDLTLTRSGVVDPVDRPRGPFIRVRYVDAADTGSLRHVWDQVDRPAATSAREAMLWDGIQTMRFRVYSEGQWLDSWPPPGTDDIAALPEGIAVTFETEKWGPIDRVVSLK
jgi:general secretion pathway protein J